MINLQFSNVAGVHQKVLVADFVCYGLFNPLARLAFHLI